MTSWPGFAALINAWWFLLLVPLIIFYFLKLRRPRYEIPSLALWRQVISDQRVNSPFQKFKRNLLLLFQILLLTSLVLGAMRPYLSANSDPGEYMPVLIDNSASMSALDGPNGKSRLEVAKEKVRKLIDDLLPEQKLCLISVNSTARKLTDFTDNKRLLHEAISRLEVTEVASRLDDGLRMAQAMSRVQPISTVIFFSDGNVPDSVEFELPFKLNFQKLDFAAPNVGIIEFNARRSKLGWDVFARIEGTKKPEGADGPPTANTQCEYQLLQNGLPFGEEKFVSIDSGKAQRLTFKVPTSIATTLELRIKPDQFDSLACDNVAYLELPAPRPLAVYCPRGMETYRNALENLSDVTLYPGEESEPTTVDLKFADKPLSIGPEAAVNFNVGFVPDDLSNLVELVSGQTEVVDWRRTSPLLQHVQLLDVQIADDPKMARGVGERDIELAGYEILAQSHTGPLILERTADGRLTYVFLFSTDRSSLVYRVGFPILVQNVTQIAAQRAHLLDAKATPTGVFPPRRIVADTEVHVAGPNGTTETATSDKDGFLSGIGAPFVGQYELSGGPESIKIGASLVSSNETSLIATEKLHFRNTVRQNTKKKKLDGTPEQIEITEEVEVSASTITVKTDQPLWGWFAMSAMAFLLLEWWYFQKRPSGVPL